MAILIETLTSSRNVDALLANAAGAELSGDMAVARAFRSAARRVVLGRAADLAEVK